MPIATIVKFATASSQAAVPDPSPLDMSGRAVQGGMTVKRTPIWESAFTAADGTEKKAYIGDRIELTVRFENIPGSLASSIQTKCSGQSVWITYLDPNQVEAKFDKPSINAVIDWEDDTGVQYWTLDLTAVCPLAGNGL